MIDYSNVPGDQFEQVFANIETAILHYQWWGHMGSNFFDSYCINCGVIRYYDIPKDYYLVKKDCYNLLVCKDCWEEIESEHAKRGIKFDTEFYCYEEIIKEYENPELEQ